MHRLAALAFATLLALPVAAATLGDDGLHKQPWFQDTFLDLGEDLAEARDSGKRLVVFFEQRGCIYCTKMHEDVFSDPELAAYIEENFFVLQLNLYGDLEVTDLDGEVLAEKDIARRWGVLFTPTMMFFPEETDGSQTAAQAAVATMPGAFGKGTTLDLFTWVAEGRYARVGETGEDFQRYHARRIQERNDGNVD